MQFPGKNKRVRFDVDRSSVFAHGAVIFLLLSAAFRLIGCWGLWRDELYAVTQIALPVVCCLLYAACILLLGRHFAVSSLPVFLGAVFFMVRTLSLSGPIRMVAGIVICLAITVAYLGTMLGVIRTKLVLLLLLDAPFLYRVIIADPAALRDTVNVVTFSAGMQEISVLCLLLGLILTVLGMKKTEPGEEVELPKIKPPKVIPPVRPEELPEAQLEQDAAVTETTEPAADTAAPSPENSEAAEHIQPDSENAGEADNEA